MACNIIAFIRPSEENRSKAFTAFNDLATEVEKSEPDCLAFRVFNNPQDGSMIIYKSYNNIDAWKHHRQMSWTHKALMDGKTEPTIFVYESGNSAGFGPSVENEQITFDADSFHVIAEINPSEGNRTCAHFAFNDLAKKVEKNEPGCVAFRVFNHESGSMIIYKSYTNMDAWKHHRDMEWTQTALVSGKTEPVIHLYNSSTVSGFGPCVERAIGKTGRAIVQNMVPAKGVSVGTAA